MSKRLFPSAVLVFLLMGCGSAASSPAGSGPAPKTVAIDINDGESLIRAMYARYANKWYHTMTFDQRTTNMRADGSVQSVQSWHEAMSLPGLLRIDFGNPTEGNGTLFRRDTNFQIADGHVGTKTVRWNELMVLGFDVYTQPPEVTISILRSLGYPMSRFRTSDVNGTSLYIIGATSRTDSVSKQFWVDRKTLTFVRMLERRPNGQQVDIQFRDYMPAGTGLIAKNVWQIIDGQTRLHEEYSNITADPVLDSALFDPKQWMTAKHWIGK